MQMMQSDRPLVATHCQAGVFTITLDNPAMRNALGSAMLDALEAAMRLAHSSAERGESIVLVLRANGSAFCSGFDLGECVNDPVVLATFVRRLGALTAAIRAVRAVVIARVQGPALAGGCALVAASDIVLASEHATFGYPVHRIGVSPAVSLPTLMATIGFGAARALAISGDIVTARRACAIGLVHRVVADDTALANSADELVASLLTKGPAALRATKAWMNEVDGTAPTGTLGRRAHDAIEATAELCASSHSRALLAAFWSKRKDSA